MEGSWQKLCSTLCFPLTPKFLCIHPYMWRSSRKWWKQYSSNVSQVTPFPASLVADIFLTEAASYQTVIQDWFPGVLIVVFYKPVSWDFFFLHTTVVCYKLELGSLKSPSIIHTKKRRGSTWVQGWPCSWKDQPCFVIPPESGIRLMDWGCLGFTLKILRR